jgi:tetratricopeptide (TPR) repeat protein
VQQVEMLCELAKSENSSPQVGIHKILFLSFSLNLALMVWAPMAKAQAQASSTELTDGKISGTVFLRVGNRPASQVAVKLRSHAAGIFRSVLTDLEGRFEVRSLPPSTYEIVVDEPGYEQAQTSAQLDGSSSNLVLYLKPSKVAQTERNSYTVSARELKIPGKAQHEYEKGLGSLSKQDFAESLSHFTKAVQAFPDYFEAYYHMGVVETRRGRLEEAMQAFQKSVDLSGGRYAWAEFGIGYILHLEGKAEEAITTVRRGLELDGNSADGYVILGMAQLRLHRPDEAEQSAREALLRNPKFAQAYLVLADACAYRHEFSSQLQSLEDYLKLQPDGVESKIVREAREAVLRIIAKTQPQE